MIMRARVHAGWLVVEEPTEPPDGTEVELFHLDPGHWLDAAGNILLNNILALAAVFAGMALVKWLSS